MEGLINKLEFAKTIVKEAGSHSREHVHDQLHWVKQTDGFGDSDDQEVQATLVGKIEAYPEDQILLKKMNFVPYSPGKVWVIDPIDGTNNFVTQRRFLLLWLLILKKVSVSFLIYDVSCATISFWWKGFGVFAMTKN